MTEKCSGACGEGWGLFKRANYMGYALVPGKFTFQIIPARNWSSCRMYILRHEGIIPTQFNIHRMPSKWLHKLDTFYLPILCWKCSNRAISLVMLYALVKTWANTGHIHRAKKNSERKNQHRASVYVSRHKSEIIQLLWSFRQLLQSRISSEWTRESAESTEKSTVNPVCRLS